MNNPSCSTAPFYRLEEAHIETLHISLFNSRGPYSLILCDDDDAEGVFSYITSGADLKRKLLAVQSVSFSVSYLNL